MTSLARSDIEPLRIGNLSNPRLSTSKRATKGFKRVADVCWILTDGSYNWSKEDDDICLLKSSDMRQPIRRVP
jgi:hypothetical protein